MAVHLQNLFSTFTRSTRVLCSSKAAVCTPRALISSTQQVNGITDTTQSDNEAENLYDVRLPTSQADNMMDIGTRAIFTSDHDIFRTTVRKFFREQISPHRAQWEKDGMVSRECWTKAGELGLLGIDTPEKHGGIGGNFIDAAVVIEEQGYANCSGTGFALHSHIVMPYITRYGTEDQSARYIPDMMSGTKIGAIAMTEPGAGSDLQSIVTNARPDGDDWILNGSKTFITNGHMCDLVIVVAITDPQARSRAHGISLIIVDEGMEGFKKGPVLDKMGLKSQDTCELFFEDVRIPACNVLGGLNKGFYHLMQDLPQERLLIGLGCAAVMEFLFEETREYVKQRKAFKKTLAHLQVVQHKLAEMKTDICVARVFTDHCLQLHVNKNLDTFTASMNKYWTSDLLNKVAYDCVQLHGGAGYMREYPVCRAFSDARINTIFGGSNEIMKELIARSIVA